MSLALSKFAPFVDGTATFANGAAEVWFFAISETKDEFVAEISSILDRYINHISTLMSAKDSYGRNAIDVAPC